MEYITKDGLVKAFREAGLEKGDTILVHSNISSFGVVENFTKKKQLETFYDAFMEVLGEEGTLCVPAFFYEYARYGTSFDIKLSPVSMELGVFSKYIVSLPNSKRSPMPTTSIAAIGKNAEYICEIKNRHGYGEDSAWDRMYKLNTKITIIGTENGMTFSHYVDYRVGLPYLYTKLYNIPVYNNGELVFDYTFSSVRYLNFNIDWYTGAKKLKKDELIAKGLMKCSEYLSSTILTVPMQPLFDYYKELLYKNPYYFLKEEPKFIPGQVPLDGNVIK